MKQIKSWSETYEYYRCTAHRAYERCKRLDHHAGAHRYAGDVVVPSPKILPVEPVHGWSPYV